MNGINLCVICGTDMGDCNPRQLCGKTRCYMQDLYEAPTQPDVSSPGGDTVPSPPQGGLRGDMVPPPRNIDEFLESEIFNKMQTCSHFKNGLSDSCLNFFETYQEQITVLKGYTHLTDEYNTYIVELDNQKIMSFDSNHPKWIFYRYPFHNPNSLLYQWNQIILDMLTPETNNEWIRDNNILYVVV